MISSLASWVNAFFLGKNNFLFLNKPSKEKPESSLRKLAMQTNETTFDFERTGEKEEEGLYSKR